ncbi:ABC transporter ATP-binding protein [Polycladidibacter hongkongensis]|uniref:ABC transporter ATP-binding protein n=1 Tax=Polycladidibacter hongkongensis TaxID=1647556 RepID=UPI00082AEFE1|nr:ABC transporter ATP-binding protein [Pseudovibrio hongkongensis]
MAILRFENLSIFNGTTALVRDLSLSLVRGETLGLVGESGSGKSLSALAALQLLPEGFAQSGSLRYRGQELSQADDRIMNRLRGRHISMIFQEPMSALNPIKSIGDQILETLHWHFKLTKKEGRARALKLLARVGLTPTAEYMGRFAHQLSGGQRQRVVIALAIACKPRVLIADEPTTALDVTVQAQILALLKEIVKRERMALLFISHDLAVIAQMADRVAVMKDGEIVEQGPTLQLFDTMQHAYSKQLLAASKHMPPKRTKPLVIGDTPLLQLHKLQRSYALPKQKFWQQAPQKIAVNQVSLRIAAQQSVGLVGESGCGKSTLARTVLGLETPQAGRISFLQQDPFSLRGQRRRQLQRGIQAVFQDPYGSFNPRHTVGRTVAEPLYLLAGQINGAERRRRVLEALTSVGLPETAAQHYPHEFSGGQRQRIAIARALVTQPQLIVADEPVSALDVSVRAQILDLLADLRDRLGVAFLFISHDLSVVRAITDYVCVMNAGRIVEEGPTQDVFSAPRHPYTRLLLSAVPDLEETLAARRKVGH